MKKRSVHFVIILSSINNASVISKPRTDVPDFQVAFVTHKCSVVLDWCFVPID